jgi:hypothetical protein
MVERRRSGRPRHENASNRQRRRREGRKEEEKVSLLLLAFQQRGELNVMLKWKSETFATRFLVVLEANRISEWCGAQKLHASCVAPTPKEWRARKGGRGTL